MRKRFLKVGIFLICCYGLPCLQSLTEPLSIRQPTDSSQVIADRIVQSVVPVLVDFWAPWCGPCRMLSPVIEELKKEYSGKIAVIKVNVDIHRNLAAYFKISAIPAVFFIKDKTVVAYLPGLQQKESYKKAIEKMLHDPENKPSGKSSHTSPLKPPFNAAAPAADDE
jgi:thioredoxin 1